MWQRGSLPRRDDGGKRHFLRTIPPRGIFHLRRHFTFLHARTDHLERPVEQAGTEYGRRSQKRNFVRVLYHASLFHQPSRLSQPESRPQQTCQLGAPRNRQVLTLNPKPAWCITTELARVRAQPFGASGHRRFASNHDPCSLNLCPRLFGVTAIGEECARAFADYKNTRCSRETAKVSDVGKMRDQQRMQTVAL